MSQKTAKQRVIEEYERRLERVRREPHRKAPGMTHAANISMAERQLEHARDIMPEEAAAAFIQEIESDGSKFESEA